MDDGDDAPWTQYNPRTGEHVVLRADRFHRADPNEKENSSQACMGIRANIWNRAKVRKLITHFLFGGGTYQLGYDALDLDFIKQGDARGTLGRYAVLRWLNISLSFIPAIISDLTYQKSLKVQAAAINIKCWTQLRYIFENTMANCI